MDREYIAFISYRHLPLDKEVATQVHRLIERYQIPKELRKNGEKHLGLVFRDQDELPLSNDLTQDIYTALDHSQFLIVVCTPDTPKSLWVQREIQYFIQKHGRNRVLTVLAAGTTAESVPEAITAVYAPDQKTVVKQIEPLCAYLVDSSQRRILQNLRSEFLRIVAAMLEVPYDAIRQRHKRYQRRRWMSVGAAVLAVVITIISLLIGWNLDISAMNQQLKDQLAVTQKNESDTLGILSLQKLQQGDRMGAVETALQGLPSEGADRAYSERSVYALSQALYLYQDSGYGFHDRLFHGEQIQNFAVSPSGKYCFLYASAGQGSLYDLETGAKMWSVQVNSDYYNFPVDDICILESDNKISFNSNGSYIELALDTGKRLYPSSPDGTDEIRYDNLAVLHGTVCMDPVSPVTAVHSYTWDRVDWSTVEHRNYVTFFDRQEQKISQSDYLPIPLSFREMNAYAFSADGKRFSCAFSDNEMLYLFVLNTETGSLCNAFSMVYDDHSITGKEGPYGTTGKGILLLEKDWVYYSNGDYLLNLDLYTNTLRSVLPLPAQVLTACHTPDFLRVILSDGTVMQLNCADLQEDPKQISQCGFSLNSACFYGTDTSRAFLIADHAPGDIISLVSLSEEAMHSETILPLHPQDPYHHWILPVPGGQGFIEYTCFSDDAETTWSGHIRQYQGPDLDLAAEYSITSENDLNFHGFCKENTCLLLGHNSLDLQTGVLTPLDTTAYSPDPIYGWDFDHSPVFTEDTQHPTITASFCTETDCLTWWSENSLMHSSISPVDVVDSYFWMHPWNLVEVGSNGLILIRNYIGNAYLDVRLEDPVVDRSRPTEYVVYSTQEDSWHSFPNACSTEGIPAVGMAADKPWIAIADYDGFIRIYDCSEERYICQIPWDVPASAVSQIQFLQEDRLLLLRHMDENVTIIRIEDGQILGKYTLTGADDTPIRCWQVPQENRIYLSNEAGTMTGICISTESWEITAQISGLICPLAETRQLLRWNAQKDRLLLTPVFDVEDLVELGESLLNPISK